MYLHFVTFHFLHYHLSLEGLCVGVGSEGWVGRLPHICQSKGFIFKIRLECFIEGFQNIQPCN